MANLSKPLAATKHQPGSAFRYRNKAEWLLAQFSPDNPSFPLDAEVIASIPKDLPGEVPTTPQELVAMLP